MDNDDDRIEQDILIDARPKRVWALVAQPGFWVVPEGGTIAAPGAPAELREGSRWVSEHPEYGSYPVIVVRSDRRGTSRTSGPAPSPARSRTRATPPSSNSRYPPKAQLPGCASPRAGSPA